MQGTQCGLLVWTMMGLLAAAGCVAAVPVDINTAGPADAELLAVSGTGSATAHGTCVFGIAAQVSGTCVDGVAISRSGPASSRSLCGNSVGYNRCVGGAAVSGGSGSSGNAQCDTNNLYCPAVSPSGRAEGWEAISVTGDAWSSYLLSASATGEASGGYWEGPFFAVSGQKDARGGIVALAPLGAATCEPVFGPPSLPCFAVSVTKDATTPGNSRCDIASCTAISVLGDATGDNAVSIAGDAHENTPYQTGHPVSVLGTCNDRACVGAGAGNAPGHYAAASATGDADCAARTCISAAGLGDARSTYVAASGTGDASGTFAAASGEGSAAGGTVALSGTGPATCSGPGFNAVVAHVGCVAVTLV